MELTALLASVLGWPCVLYVIAYEVRRVTWSRLPTDVDEEQKEIIYANASSRYVRRLKKKLLKTQSVDDFVKSGDRNFRLFMAAGSYVHWTSPAMIVVFPVAYCSHVIERGWAAGFWGALWNMVLLATAVLWTIIAWTETKNDGPRWRKRAKRLLAKVQVQGQKLVVVPVKAR